MDSKIRCPWCLKSETERHYHDTEWGMPLYDDRKLFEFVILDGFQAGLSWKIVLDKREAFRESFFNFDADILAALKPNQVDIWMQNSGIVRNRLKLEAVIKNAKAYLGVKNELGSFSDYLWEFVGGKPIVNQWPDHHNIPAATPEAEAMSKDMKKRGFTFCGPTICYAFMQAAGMVNDHMVSCFRYREVNQTI